MEAKSEPTEARTSRKRPTAESAPTEVVVFTTNWGGCDDRAGRWAQTIVCDFEACL